MNDLEQRSDPAARLAESVRRALAVVGPAESGMERVSDERPAERPIA